MAYARHVTDTSAAQAHPYDPSLRREHWRRILSESPLPSAELVEGWFYRTGSKNDHPLDHNAAAILVEHMAQRITSALSFSSSSSRLSSSSLAGVKYEDLSVGDDEGDPVRDQALRCAPGLGLTPPASARHAQPCPPPSPAAGRRLALASLPPAEGRISPQPSWARRTASGCTRARPAVSHTHLS